jgi:hypothetical protein
MQPYKEKIAVTCSTLFPARMDICGANTVKATVLPKVDYVDNGQRRGKSHHIMNMNTICYNQVIA